MFVALGFAVFSYIQKSNRIEAVTNFEECAKVYPVMESYPAQCRTPDGRHFVQTI